MGSALVVILYTKPGCGLCGPVRDTIARVRADLGFRFDEVDISGDSELTRLYGLEVPVVTIDGRKAFKGQVTETALRKRLKRAQQQRGAPAPTPARVESLEALEVLEPEVGPPPRPAVWALAGLAAAGFAYFASEGWAAAQRGEGRISSQLLRVEARAELPVSFSLPAMEGGQVSLDDFRGKVVFINFWATWCPPCIEEMPSMRKLAQRLAGDDRFVMLAISADEGWAPVREFFAKEPAPFRVLLDQDGKLAKRYGTEKFPETYVMFDGQLIGKIVGPRDWDGWYADAYLKDLLAQAKLGS